MEGLATSLGELGGGSRFPVVRRFALLNQPTRIEVDRIKRRLSADVEAIAVLASETDIGDDLSDRDRAEMRPVR